jgi:hypothetical protein
MGLRLTAYLSTGSLGGGGWPEASVGSGGLKPAGYDYGSSLGRGAYADMS